MAMVVRVEPAYNGKIAVQSNNSLNGTVLSNSLTQEVLLAIYQNQPELRGFLFTEYTTVGGSYAPSDIDPALIHAYGSEEITHNPAGVYPANTVGKHLNDTKAKIDGFDNAFVRPSTAPSLNLNFAGSKFWNPKIPFSRNSIGTYIDQNGVIKTAVANKPRFTHDPITKESLGLLMEEARTNLATYSNDYTNGSYTKNRVSVVASTVIAPDGSYATKIVEDTTPSNTHSITKNDCALLAGISYTASIFLKSAERSTCLVQLANASLFGGSIPTVQVDLALGTLSNSLNNFSTKIEAFGNGWYRISITVTPTTSGNSGIITYLSQGAISSYTGDSISGIYIFGMQVEAGLNATSYIPTTTAAVLRDTDIINITSSIFTELFPNVTEGTLYFSAKKADYANQFRPYARFLGVATAGGNNNISIRDHGTLAKVYTEIYNNGVNVFENATAFDVAYDSYFQYVMAYKLNDAKTYNNGVAGVADSNMSIPNNMSSFQLGGSMNTIIKSVAFWPRRITDAGLLALTSPTAITGKNPAQLPANGDLQRGAFTSPEAILRTTGRQEFSVDGTGASITRNIRRPYDFSFEVVDNAGVTTMTATPATGCVANTDNPLTFTAPAGKTLTYAITPVYEY